MKKPDHQMKNNVKHAGLIGAMLFALAAGTGQAQVQITAGAVSTNVNEKLAFANGANYAAASGYVHPLVYTVVSNVNLNSGYYSSTNLAFGSLSSTNPGAASIGTYIVCQVVSVTGPEGGVLSFWERGSRVPNYSFPVGESFSEETRFDVSDIALGAGLPDGDPAGSIPGRRWTVNKGGEYVVGYQLVDTSSNSLAITSLHTPSDILYLKFSTGVDLGLNRLSLSNNIATVVFRQGSLTNVFVETSTNLISGTWTVAAGPFPSAPAGTNTTTRVFTNSPGFSALFYRLRGVAP